MAWRLGALLAAGALLAGGCGGGSAKKVASTTAVGAPGAQFAAAPASQDATPPSYRPTGQIVAQSTFKPEVDGFSFPNYAKGYQDLTPAQMVELFGTKVCASGTGADCVLTPPAQTWMNSMNQAMDNGHCYGFSATALMMFGHILNPFDYGGNTVPSLLLQDNVPLQQRIAESWVLQLSAPVQTAEVKGTPSQVLDALIAALPKTQEAYTMNFFKRDWKVGHAVTPYAVEDRGGGKFVVLMYDNNFPGITRGFNFDRSNDTWSYEASSNPGVQSSLYEGDAKSQTVFLAPTSPGVGVQPCPFCSPGTAGRVPRGAPAALTPGRYEEVFLSGDSVNHAHLLITDTAGRRLGYVNGRLVNEIPGARFEPLALTQNWAESPEPLYRVPRNVKFTIAIDGGSLQAADPESVSVIGPGHAATVSNLTMRPGQRDELQLTGTGTRLTYRTGPGQAQRPQLAIGLTRAGQSFKFAVTAPPLAGGSALTAVAQPARGRLSLDAGGVKSAGTYDLAVTRILRSGPRPAQGKAVKVASGGSAQLRFGP